jgi:hypothetical protein
MPLHQVLMVITHWPVPGMQQAPLGTRMTTSHEGLGEQLAPGNQHDPQLENSVISQ